VSDRVDIHPIAVRLGATPVACAQDIARRELRSERMGGFTID
jgi:hypothetical protein